jgi:hypothetical protein
MGSFLGKGNSLKGELLDNGFGVIILIGHGALLPSPDV